MPKTINCTSCTGANVLAPQSFWQKAMCGNCGATLPVSALERIGRTVFPMRFTLCIAVALTMIVVIVQFRDASQVSNEPSSGLTVDGAPTALNSPPAVVPQGSPQIGDNRRMRAIMLAEQNGWSVSRALLELYNMDEYQKQYGNDAAAIAAARKRDGRLQEDTVATRQGVQEVMTSAPRIAPLQIVTPSGEENYYIKIEEASTGRLLITLFVNGGQNFKTRVPLGSVRIKYATGAVWYGTTRLFGPSTQYSQADKVFEFVRDDGGIQGYTVQLIKQIGGNLNTTAIGASDF